MASFRIRDRKTLGSIIIPIFDKYPLLTTKYFNYAKFKKAYSILENSELTVLERNRLLEDLKSTKPAESYISPAWDGVTLPKTRQAGLDPLGSRVAPGGALADANEASGAFRAPLTEAGACRRPAPASAHKVMSKPWLVGFVEAEGSFYLVSKDAKRIVHGFGVTQKLDVVVLEAIRHILHISTKVVFKKQYNHHMIDTTNSRAISNVSKYFLNTMKGMKSVEYRIWSRSFKNNKGDFEKLYKVRELLRKLRTKKADNLLWVPKS